MRASEKGVRFTILVAAMWCDPRQVCAWFEIPPSCTLIVHSQTHFFHYVWPYITLSPWEGSANTEYPNGHISSCTWLNVTVGHILIYGRYRVNDGRGATFTQAGDFLPSPRRDGEKRKDFLSFHDGSLKKKEKRMIIIQPLPSHFSPLSTLQFAPGSVWAVETSLCAFGDRKNRGWSCARSFMLVCIFTPPHLLLKCLPKIPPSWKSVTVFTTGKQLQQTLHYSPRATASSALPALHFFALIQPLPPSFAPWSTGCWQATVNEPKFKTQRHHGTPTGTVRVLRNLSRTVVDGAPGKMR